MIKTREVKKWMGNKPTKCDACQNSFGAVFYDARTKQGRWGLLCHQCFIDHGTGLGTGCGQKYDTNTLIKIGG